ncbi:uncharacterized protein K444DRAFT_347969 [Hyaloscypha bicolor E]|uniref:Secreted protein n=1 Tax=Hyaloscypha bicolor E TaxID=1095630 RepID=A0A2J6TI71_9HELO|nr:uncharacterized protein K444DRAFT_347969 [Hyaloscypha bicolor E]PMD62704.1 hypothetical protein K444DRAFT_347969 [Hyaloscypha bicolor E]
MSLCVFITALLIHECLFWDSSRVKEGPNKRGTVKSVFTFPCFLTTDCRVHFYPNLCPLCSPRKFGKCNEILILPFNIASFICAYPLSVFSKSWYFVIGACCEFQPEALALKKGISEKKICHLRTLGFQQS